MPRCPTGSETSWMSARGAARRDRPDRLGLSDLVVLADKAQDGPIDVGEGQRLPVDDHAAGQHPVLRDELPQRVGERRSRPGDPAFRLDKAPLALVGQQRFAIVQLPQELDA